MRQSAVGLAGGTGIGHLPNPLAKKLMGVVLFGQDRGRVLSQATYSFKIKPYYCRVQAEFSLPVHSKYEAGTIMNYIYLSNLNSGDWHSSLRPLPYGR